MKLNKKGFTLMEIMIAVIIIGILTTISLPYYLRNVEKQRAVTALRIMADIARSEERYYNTSYDYTNRFEDLDIDLNKQYIKDGKYVPDDYFVFDINNEGDYKVLAYRGASRADNSLYILSKDFESDENTCSPGTDKDFCEEVLGFKSPDEE